MQGSAGTETIVSSPKSTKRFMPVSYLKVSLPHLPPGECAKLTHSTELIIGTPPERFRTPGFCGAEAGKRAAAPFPTPLSPPVASCLRFAPDNFLLTKPNTFCTIEKPASLRSDGVRDHPGMPFGIPPE